MRIVLVETKAVTVPFRSLGYFSFTTLTTLGFGDILP